MNFVNVVSSNLSQVGYNPNTMEMTVIFHNQRAYTYSNVPESVLINIRAGPSISVPSTKTVS